MDDLQYNKLQFQCGETLRSGFKPCYKWMTFNTVGTNMEKMFKLVKVLNLVINGWPSILEVDYIEISFLENLSFKPCYKWMTFNTLERLQYLQVLMVLNLVINGWPSIPQLF